MRDLRSSTKRRPGYTKWTLTIDGEKVCSRETGHFENVRQFRKWALNTTKIKEMGITEIHIEKGRRVINLGFTSQSI